MTSRVLAPGLFVAMTFALAAPAGAQDSRMRLGEDSPEVAQQKRAVQTFSKVIESAVKNGGDSLANRARVLVPELQLFMDGPPLVSAVKVPDVGFLFDVQIPDVSSASIEMFSLLRELPRARPAANGLPAPPPPTAAALMDFDVGREYGNYVRDALVEAMLMYSDALPLESHERLVIVGRTPQLDALALQPANRKLVLQLLASDVLALRDGRITRDEARARIIESRF